MTNQLPQPPSWIFRGKVPLDDSKVQETLLETGGFHDSFLSIHPQGDEVLALRFRDPYFWKKSATGLWGIEAANFLLRCDLVRDHGELAMLSGIHDFEVYSVEIEKSSKCFELSIEVFFDIHLPVMWQESWFFWTFRN